MEPLLTIKDLEIKFGHYTALQNINFTVNHGDYISIVGPNGAGKSTLIKAILGLIKPTCGTIIKHHEDINLFGYLPQQSFNFDKLFPATVTEVVSTGLLSNKKHPKFITSLDREAINNQLEALGIYELRKQKIGTLSGGQQQRVFLARALVSKLKILILDESTSVLDSKFRNNFYEIIEDINLMQKVSILHVTHDVSRHLKCKNNILYIDKEIIYFGDYHNYLNKHMKTLHTD